MFYLWEKHPDIKNDLIKVKEIMIDAVNSGVDSVDRPVIDFINSGGKFLRPAFVILGSKFGKEQDDEIFSLAAIVELLHISTLIHDDIIDHSKLRRGGLTIQYKYGSKSAVFIGDYLFTLCFNLLTEKYSMKEMKALSKVISVICLGEVKQNSFKSQNNITVKDYLNMIARKTAALFSLGLYIGASYSKADEQVVRDLRYIGYLIGMAFQIQDDILDFTADPSVLGKDPENDIKEGYYTLPVIYAKQSTLKDIDLEKENPEKIINLIHNSGSIEKCKSLANKYIEKAVKRIDSLPEIESRLILKEIIDVLKKRDY